MKKSALLLCGIFCGYMGSCLAVNPIYDVVVDGCYSQLCTGVSGNYYFGASPSARNCLSQVAQCVYVSGEMLMLASCVSCNPGYELVQGSGGVTACDIGPGGEGDGGSVGHYNYTYCTKNCSASNCAPSAWTAKGTGYETRTNRACSTTGTSGTCNESTQYRCAAGYSGSSTNGTSGCALCPEATSIYTNSARTTNARGTSAAGTTAQTGCYLAAGTYYDASGTFSVTGTNCTY